MAAPIAELRHAEGIVAALQLQVRRPCNLGGDGFERGRKLRRRRKRGYARAFSGAAYFPRFAPSLRA